MDHTSSSHKLITFCPPSSPRPGQKDTQRGPPVLSSSSLEESRSVVDVETQAPRESADESMIRMGKWKCGKCVWTIGNCSTLLQEMEQIVVLLQNGGATESFWLQWKSKSRLIFQNPADSSFLKTLLKLFPITVWWRISKYQVVCS